MTDVSKIDLSRPQYDQNVYLGRVKHFFKMTNPLNLLATNAQLEEAKRVVTEFKKTKTLPPGYDVEKLWQQKYLYDSAFHPDTGEKGFIIGRMSAQVPMNTLIVGAMLTFYRTTAGTVFCQWVNQTFNAIVNYTNRSGDAVISKPQLFASYLGGVGGALTAALFLNSRVKHMNPMFARLVPYAAVCTANFVNIPMMRSQEVFKGTAVFSPDGKTRFGESTRAGRWGIFLVALSRNFMCLPGMTITPFATNWATKKGLFCNRQSAIVPFQMLGVGICTLVATPLACALFDQQASYKVDGLEPELKETIKKTHPQLDYVVYNKGL